MALVLYLGRLLHFKLQLVDIHQCIKYIGVFALFVYNYPGPVVSEDLSIIDDLHIILSYCES